MSPSNLLEKDVAKEVTDFLRYRGWRRFRNQSSVSVNQAGTVFRSGEKGMPDLLFVRYHPVKKPWSMMLWIETKRPKGKASAYQLEWREKEQSIGATVVLVSDFREFEAWYNDKLGWLHSSAGIGPGNLDLFAKLPDTG